MGSSEECSSSESIDYHVGKVAPECDAADVLLAHDPAVESPSRLFSVLGDCHGITSGDLILGLASIARYADARSALQHKIAAVADRLIDSLSGDVFLFYNARIGNTPLSMVFELYKGLEAGAGHYVCISQTDVLDRQGLEDACRMFPEFSKEDLRRWPRKNEEVFLLRCPRKACCEIAGAKFSVFVLDQDEFKQFRDDFCKEISQ